MEDTRIRYVSLFSGIEAASVAWEHLGWVPMAFSEIEPFPCAVLEKRFPGVPNLGDITKIDWGEFADGNGRPDVVVGGSPCQSFSIAGGRESLDGESRLMFEYIRAVRELRPRWFVWENVPGALSAKGQDGGAGGAFGQLLSELGDCGYGMAWRVLDAQFVRVPDGMGGWFGPVAQRRRRVFLVGFLGDPRRPAEVLFERSSLRGDLEPSRQKRESLAGDLAAGAGGGRGAGGAGVGECRLNPDDPRTERVYHGNLFPSLCGNSSGGQNRQAILAKTEPVPINTMVATRFPVEGAGTGMGVGEPGEAGYTLSATHSHAVCVEAHAAGACSDESPFDGEFECSECGFESDGEPDACPRCGRKVLR